MRQLRTITAALSIALVAFDLVLSVAGHSHDHLSDGAAHGSSPRHASGCSHHHGCCSLGQKTRGQEKLGQEKRGQESRGEENELPAAPEEHDDCSLCRHFQQPVVAASIDIQLDGCQRITPLFVRAAFPFRAALLIVYPARGPPVM